jgi:hypothetical protein
MFVFAKNPDDTLAGLVKAIDKVVEENDGKRVAAVVNFTGQRTDDYLAKIKEFGEKHGIDNVALTVTTDGDRFNVNDEAAVTVMHYKNKKVMFNHAVGPDGPKPADVEAIVAGAKKIL